MSKDKSHNQFGLVGRIIRFYVEGFREMTLGRCLWALILIKLALLFLVFRIFFFPDRLQRDYSSDEQRAKAVRRELMRPHGMNDSFELTESLIFFTVNCL
ncbi:MAG: DUF4492 domain-containing protein [Paramuribaculum sp.]|nr:DUF4492 domain-containing protein [Paramuribaculum sp.]MDE6324299.1 DUF4492 domain-containing protein [Paramuribaculum sp.]MDE6489345.1 DUF4492 domain-containing protein [Paramuribaculum sp.]